MQRAIAAHAGRTRRRRLLDRLFAGVFTAGGLVVILSIGGMLLFMVGQVAPLWQPVRYDGQARGSIEAIDASHVLSLGTDESLSHVYIVQVDGLVRFFDLSSGAEVLTVGVPGLDHAHITAVEMHPEIDELTMATDDGRLIPASVRFALSYDGGERHVTPAITFGEPVLMAQDEPLAMAVHRNVQGGSVSAALGSSGRLYLVTRQQARGLLNAGQTTESRTDLTAQLAGHQPTAIAVDPRGEMLVVGDAAGGLSYWNLRDRQSPLFVGRTITGDAAVTSLGFLLGGQSIIVGNDDGTVSQWFVAPQENVPKGRQFTHVRSFKAHGEEVVSMIPSRRNKSFITVDASGHWALHHATSHQTLLEVDAAADTRVQSVLSPRGNAYFILDLSGGLLVFDVDNPHPEATLGTLFGKVWYEGYAGPDYVWQSTGGSDGFEPKISLVPLLFGTLKGAFYALCISVPLAVLAAVYTSLFMSPPWRKVVKPAIELMAAVPSVVLGFIGGLWLAPWLERNLLGFVVAGVMVPVALILVAQLWRRLPAQRKQFLPGGMEILITLPLVLLIGYAALRLGLRLEQALPAGDYRQWLFDAFGVRYDQRNAMVVAIAMGFAVVPVIYCIAEDALFSVPKHLLSGSLALGASLWQTARRVVIPAASPAIFSAVMMGFGRAVGETMIVLMATGNTALMDWSPFNGFRSLAANIAVEMSEAPVGGTLYRVLFLTALLLFLFTFAVNTLAEWLRQRLRKQWT